MQPARAAAVVLVLALVAAADEPPRDLRSYIQEAAAAHEKQDYKGFLESYRKAAELAPRHIRVTYNLACALALNGKPAEAAAQLDKLADMGLFFEPARDDDFAGIKDDPAFVAVGKRFEALKAPVGTSTVAFRVPERDLIPEGIAYDPGTRSFLMSSVHKRKVIRLSAQGGGVFVSEGQDGLWATLGLAVDARRRTIWVGSAAIPQMKGFVANEEGRAGLFGYDSAGRLVRKALLSNVGAKHNLGDLVVDSKGAVFVSDSVSSAVYRLDPNVGNLDVWIPAGQFASPQGLAFYPDEQTLYIADYSKGLARVDVATRKVTFLEAPEKTALVGMDGLYAVPGGLIAIQNGVRPHRVVHLALKAGEVQQLTVLEANNPSFEEPTLGVVVGGDFYYVANSQWNRFKEDGSLPPAAELAEPVILKLALPRP